MTKIFFKIFYIVGYNFTNARNGNSILKISSLRPLESKFVCQFEFSENFRGYLWKMLLESKVLLSSDFFYTNLSFFKIQTVIKSHSFMPGASNWAILIFLACFSGFLNPLTPRAFYQRPAEGWHRS